MSTLPRDDTSAFRHATPGCVVCGGALHRAGTGRRRLYCGPACRQRAYVREHQRCREIATKSTEATEVSRA